MARALIALALAAVAPGCLVDVDYGETRFLCDSDGACPAGQRCLDGFCSAGEPALDAAPDAPADAPPDAASVPGRVLYWSLDEGSGAVAHDDGGGGIDGAISGTTWIASPHGGALELDGDLDEVRVAPAPGALEPAAVAVAAWIQPVDPGTSGREVASMGDAWGLRAVATGARFFVYQGADWVSADSAGVDLYDGAWHHVVGQYDGATIEIYVDGALAGSTAHDLPISYTLGPDLVIGRHGNGEVIYDYSGGIDELEVFERPLEPSEIAARADL